MMAGVLHGPLLLQEQVQPGHLLRAWRDAPPTIAHRALRMCCARASLTLWLASGEG